MPFISRPYGARVSIKDIVSAIFGGVVKEVASINPSPSIWVPPHSGKFTIEENNFLSFPFFLRPPISANDFNLVEEPFKFALGAFPLPKASRVCSYRVALHRERQGKRFPLQTFGSIFLATSNDQSRVFLCTNIEA